MQDSLVAADSSAAGAGNRAAWAGSLAVALLVPGILGAQADNQAAEDSLVQEAYPGILLPEASGAASDILVADNLVVVASVVPSAGSVAVPAAVAVAVEEEEEAPVWGAGQDIQKIVPAYRCA